MRRPDCMLFIIPCRTIPYPHSPILRFQQILLYHMEHDDYLSVMATCKRHG